MARNVGEDANVEIEILAKIRSHALQSLCDSASDS